MDIGHGIHSLQLQQQLLFDNKVCPVRDTDLMAFVSRIQRRLALEPKPSRFQLDRHGRRIRTFKKPCSEMPLHFDGARDHLVRKLIDKILLRILRSFCGFCVRLLN